MTSAREAFARTTTAADAHDDPTGSAQQGMSQCPQWCERPAEHGWDDEWCDGPVRFHTRRIAIGEHHQIDVREIEQSVSGQPRVIRQREIVLDVEPAMDVDAAQRTLRALAEAIEFLCDRVGDGTDGTVN